MLDGIPIERLHALLARHMGKPAWPGLDDPAARRRAIGYAKKYGMWQRLAKQLDPAKPMPVQKRSEFRSYRRTGLHKDETFPALVHELEAAALALWLGHPAGNVDFLQDRIWALCEKSTWVTSYTEYCRIDLISSKAASVLSEIVWILGSRLEAEVKDRVRSEVLRRVLDPAYDYRSADWWRTTDMNWNPVCNANTISAALYHFRDDAWLLASYLHPIIARLQYAIDGFCDDGGCREGALYWNYGFEHFVQAALMLHHRTGGKLNLMAGAKVERICRFPLAAHIAGPVRACFGDCGNGYIGAETAIEINRFHDVPELYSIARRHADGRLAVSGWRGLVLYNGQRAGAEDLATDYFLPDLGLAKAHGGKGAGRTTLVAVAGRNDFPHNHNDIGSFVVYRKGASLLTDPGGPLYTAKTFGPRRYEIIHCRSLGHSVPLVNGLEQRRGRRHYGTMRAAGLNTDAEKTVAIDMTHAYRDPTLKSLVRTFVLRCDGAVVMTDAYEFTRRPQSLEEAFVTYEPARVVAAGRAVRIGSGKAAGTLSCSGTPGRFQVRSLGEESKSWHTPKEIIRIAFRPKRLSESMTLVFAFS